MSWFTDLANAASEAYQARQDALGEQAQANEAEAATQKVNWPVVGGIAAIVGLVLVLLVLRKK